MKLVYVSDLFNHYQMALSDELFELLGEDYQFVSYSPLSTDRIRLGWNEEQRSYLIKGYEQNDYGRAIETINTADIVIYGAAPEKYIHERKKNGKVVIGYSERLFKSHNGIIGLLYRLIKYRYIYSCKNQYLLCCSAFASADYAKLGLFKDRAFKWGYFSEERCVNDIDDFIEKKKRGSIIWVARFIDWKRPEDVVEMARRLCDVGVGFSLKMVGEGELLPNIESRIKQYGIADKVELVGAMSPEEVRKAMDESEIAIVTSDRNEGWGVVLNEEMNSACAIVASHMVGAVPFLIDDAVNGMVYESGNVDQLTESVKRLLLDKKLRIRMGKKAYECIHDKWNPRVAADRLVKLGGAIWENKRLDLFEDGPCSKAEIMDDGWRNRS